MPKNRLPCARATTGLALRLLRAARNPLAQPVLRDYLPEPAQYPVLPTPPIAPTCRPLLPWLPPTQARDWAWWASHRWPAMKWCERQSESAVHRVAACSGGWCTAPGAAAIQAAHRRRSCSPAPPWAHHLRFLSAAAPCLLPHLASQPLAKLSRGGGRADDQEHRHVDSATGVCLPGKGWGQQHATVGWQRRKPICQLLQ